jgi:hypothetical protein
VPSCKYASRSPIYRYVPKHRTVGNGFPCPFRPIEIPALSPYLQSVFIPKDYNGILGSPVRIVPAGFAMTSREWGVTVSDGAPIEDRDDNACALFIVPLVLDAGGWRVGDYE